MNDTILEVKNIVRKFPIVGGADFVALGGISLEVKKSTLTIFKGRSGSGKTTLLNILGALDRPTSGEVNFMGKNIANVEEEVREKIRREKIGFVFQSVSLIPMMSAYENVEFSLRMAGITKGRQARTEECLRLVGLTSRMHHMPQELSGGEQQRVAIARAVAHKPELIFADEPTAELDSASSVFVAKLFKEMTEKEKVTIIMTTHDIGLMGIGDAIYELSDGMLVNSIFTERENE